MIATLTKSLRQGFRMFVRHQPEQPIRRTLALPECLQEIFGDDLFHVRLPPFGVVTVIQARDI